MRMNAGDEGQLTLLRFVNVMWVRWIIDIRHGTVSYIYGWIILDWDCAEV